MKQKKKLPIGLHHTLCCAALAFVLFAISGVPEAHAAAKNKNRKADGIAHIMPSSDDVVQLAEAQIVPLTEMDTMRAGFIDPTGLIFRFAVDIRSRIDGALLFARSIVLQRHQNNDALQAVNNTVPSSKELHITSNTQQLVEQNIPEGNMAKVLGNGAGIVLSDAKGGQTAILNQVSSGAFSSVITNTADYRAISQTLNIDIVLQNIQTSMGSLSALRNLHAPTGLNQISRMHTIGFGL